VRQRGRKKTWEVGRGKATTGFGDPEEGKKYDEFFKVSCFKFLTGNKQIRFF
jgi:hypothetical protein